MRSHLASTLTAIVALLLLVTACAAAETAPLCEDDTSCLHYGIAADIPILDPHRADSPEAGMILRQIYDTLIYRAADTHEFLPGLATGWDVSEDGTVYTFYLRQDLRFHNGSPFNAQAVGRNIERIFSPALPHSRARELLGPLSQYEIVDDYTLRLYLFAPYAAFLDAWAQPFLGIANPEALQEYGDLRYQFHQGGTGPFRLSEYLPGERVELERNLDYATLPAVYPALAGDEIQRVVFSISREDRSEALTLLRDSLDVIDDIHPASARNLASNSRVRILPVDIPSQTAQFVLNTGSAHLSRLDTRRALLLATNRVAISNQIFFGFSPPAWAPLAESTGYSHTGYIGEFAFDRAGAQSLLEAAGYRDDDNDGLLERDGEPLELRMVAPPWGRWPEVAAYLRSEWRSIGIGLDVEPVPGRARLESLIESGEYDLLPVDNSGIDPDLLSRVFADNARYQSSMAPHARLSELLRAAGQEADIELRRGLYYDIQALLMSEALVLPIRENTRLTAAKAEVQGLRFDAYGFYPLLYNTRIASG